MVRSPGTSMDRSITIGKRPLRGHGIWNRITRSFGQKGAGDSLHLSFLYFTFASKKEIMADNYIERQQEQYEARKAAWKQAQKYGKKKTGTTHQVRTGQADKIPSDANRRKRRVFVTGGAEGIGKAIVEAFSQADCLVAFCDTNDASGQQPASCIYHFTITCHSS